MGIGIGGSFFFSSFFFSSFFSSFFGCGFGGSSLITITLGCWCGGCCGYGQPNEVGGGGGYAGYGEYIGAGVGMGIGIGYGTPNICGICTCGGGAGADGAAAP